MLYLRRIPYIPLAAVLLVLAILCGGCGRSGDAQAGPAVLGAEERAEAAALLDAQLGLLKDKKATCYPGFEEALTGAEVSFDPVVVCGNVTTSRGMGTAIPFALALTEQLAGKEKADALAKGIIYAV